MIFHLFICVHKTGSHTHTRTHSAAAGLLSEQTGPELEISKSSPALHIHVLHDGES